MVGKAQQESQVGKVLPVAERTLEQPHVAESSRSDRPKGRGKNGIVSAAIVGQEPVAIERKNVPKQRWNRKAYNTYQRELMRKRRASKRVKVLGDDNETVGIKSVPE